MALPAWSRFRTCSRPYLLMSESAQARAFPRTFSILAHLRTILSPSLDSPRAPPALHSFPTRRSSDLFPTCSSRYSAVELMTSRTPQIPRGSSILDHLRTTFTARDRSYEHTPELQSRCDSVWRCLRGAGFEPARAPTCSCQSRPRRVHFLELSPYLLICAPFFPLHSTLPAPPPPYTLSLHDALPICFQPARRAIQPWN